MTRVLDALCPSAECLGYFAGASFRRVQGYLGKASLLLLVVPLAVVAVVLLARYVAQHRERVGAAAG